MAAYAAFFIALVVLATGIFVGTQRLGSTDTRSRAALQEVVAMIWNFQTTGNTEKWTGTPKTAVRAVDGSLEVVLRSTDPAASTIEVQSLDYQLPAGVKQVVIRAGAYLPPAPTATPKSRPLPTSQPTTQQNTRSTYAPLELSLAVNHKDGPPIMLPAQRLPLESGMNDYLFIIPQEGMVTVRSLRLGFANHPENTLVRIDSVKLATQVNAVTDIPTSQSKTVYRLVSKTGSRFYTADASMREAMVRNGWTVEGVTLRTPTAAVAGAVPVYELYNKNSEDFFYTTGADEARTAKGFGYAPYNSKEAADALPVVWHAFSTPASDRTPVYRLVNAQTGKHFYTTSINERDVAVAQFGYTIEGLVFYVLK